MVDYINVKIPEELRLQFEDLNDRHGLGYSSFAEIVKESLRKRFEEIREIYERDHA